MVRQAHQPCFAQCLAKQQSGGGFPHQGKTKEEPQRLPRAAMASKSMSSIFSSARVVARCSFLKNAASFSDRM